MTPRLSRLPRIAFLLIAATVLAVGLACGGGGDSESDAPTASERPGPTSGDDKSADASPELQAYFAEIQAIFDTADKSLNELEAAFNDAYDAATNVEEAKQALGSFLLDTRQLNGDALDKMERVEPPDEVKDEHAAFVAAGRDLLDLAERLFDRLQGVETEDDLNALSDEFDQEGTAAAGAADSACLDLQGIADEAQIEIDLKCED